MTQTISDLWNGNIAPCEHCGAHDAEANRLISIMERSRDALCEGLTASQMQLLQRYMDSSDAYLLRMLELAFGDGFCLGSRLAIDSLT